MFMNDAIMRLLVIYTNLTLVQWSYYGSHLTAGNQCYMFHDGSSPYFLSPSVYNAESWRRTLLPPLTGLTGDCVKVKGASETDTQV